MIKRSEREMWTTFFEQYGDDKIQDLLKKSYSTTDIIYPYREDVFTAYQMTPPNEVRVVILGQDPYILEGQAHGLAFSIYSSEAKVPPTMKNIFKELETEYGELRTNTNLTDWAKQGVFLLNTILTVKAGESLSHKHIGWQDFTKATIEYLNTLEQPICYLLLGNDARKYEKYITSQQAHIIHSAHPSPLAAYRGFFGSNVFLEVNQWLSENGVEPIRWL